VDGFPHGSEHGKGVPIAADLSRIIARESSLMAHERAGLDSEDGSCLFQMVIDHCVEFTRVEPHEDNRPSSKNSRPRHESIVNVLPERSMHPISSRKSFGKAGPKSENLWPSIRSCSAISPRAQMCLAAFGKQT